MTFNRGYRIASRLGRSCLPWVAIAAVLIPIKPNRGTSAQVQYLLAQKYFLQGYLAKSQFEAEQGYNRFLHSDAQWASKFQLQEAEAMVWRGKSEEALRILSQPPLNSIEKDPEQTVQKLTLEGAASVYLQDFATARQRLSDAENLCKQQTNPSCRSVIKAKGILAGYERNFPEARQLFLECLSAARSQGDRRLETVALSNLGWISLQIEHYDEAVDWLKQARQSALQIGAADQEQVASGNLGWAYLGLGDSQRSSDLFLKAEDQAVLLGDYHAEITWLKAIGYLDTGNGESAKAKKSYGKALQLADEIHSKEDISDILTDLGLVAVASGDPDEAERYAGQARALAQQSRSWPDELDAIAVQMQSAALRGDEARAMDLLRVVEANSDSQTAMKWACEDAMAKLYEAKAEPAKARAAYLSALRIFEEARAQLQHEDLQLPFVANATRIYDDYIRFLIAQGKPEEALLAADQSRARTLAQGLDLISKEKAFHPAAISPQAVARKAGATLLFYWLGERQSYLWAVTPEKTALFPLPRQGDITPLLDRYRKALLNAEDPLDSPYSPGRALYTMLVAPAAKLIGTGPGGAKRPVIILADGPLSLLNFETLIATGEGGQPDHYWIEDATVSSAPSLAMLSAAKPAVAVAGEARNETGGRSARGRLLLLGDAEAHGDEFSKLPFAPLEMRRIESHFNARDAVAYAGRQATPRAYLESDPGRFDYIHFVSHGVASRTEPLDSAIILSRDETGDGAAGGGQGAFKLYARDIMRHPIAARLVTISACNGSGSVAYAGEGLVGLSWAFLRAGAHSAIGALWEVSDNSTPQLMDAMYRSLEDGDSPAAALREAKLALVHSKGNFRKPFYWAPFQLYTRL